MSSIRHIARKEIEAFFSSLAGLIFIAVFLGVCLFVFFWVETFFARNIADVRIVSVEGVERIGDAKSRHVYTLTLHGNDPDEVAPVVARAVHDQGYRLFALHPEQRDIETIFAEIAGAVPTGRETAHV